MASNTLCQVEPTSSRWGENPEGWFSNRSLQEPLGCGWKESALCRPSRTISDAAKPCFWARACHKINLLRVKGCLGHWSSWNKCGDTTPCWHGGSHKQRGPPSSLWLCPAGQCATLEVCVQIWLLAMCGLYDHSVSPSGKMGPPLPGPPPLTIAHSASQMVKGRWSRGILGTAWTNGCFMNVGC